MIDAARTAPPRGAPKMAPMPAPTPNDTRILPSSSERCSRRASIDEKPAEIWAAGPSRPAEPPEPMVRALEIILTTTTRARMCRGSVWIASIALSVPWPLASGANLATISADTSAPAVVTSGSAHGLE